MKRLGHFSLTGCIFAADRVLVSDKSLTKRIMNRAGQIRT